MRFRAGTNSRRDCGVDHFLTKANLKVLAFGPAATATPLRP
jgi:hypothetical protein